jgi:hypothetical protein
MWCGHLVIAIEDLWLLDATLDQANKYTEWPASAWVGPVVVKLSNPFWKAHKPAIVQVNETSVMYYLYPKQNGFAHSEEARPSSWGPLSNMIMEKLEQNAWSRIDSVSRRFRRPLLEHQ